MGFLERSRWLLILILLASVAPDTALAASHDDWAERTLRTMTLEEKVGQMFMDWAKVSPTSSTGADYERLRETMQRYHLGSFAVTVRTNGSLLLKSSAFDAAALTNQLQRDSPLPLLFAADLERGLPTRFLDGTPFPHAMAFGATRNPDYAYQFGRITATEARAIGIQLNFYPDADVNSNPNNPIINTRSFGEDPGAVATMVAAFIRGAHAGGGLVTAKHFPGHGDVAVDSHLALPSVTGSREHLKKIELPPFRAAIGAGVDAVMVGHLLVPAVDANAAHPATLSPKIETKLLRGKLGFHGLIVTDAMNMNAVTRLYGGNAAQGAARSAVAAVEAGNDILVAPGDLDAAWHGVVEAVRRGEISEHRIDDSVRRILRVKQSLGLDRNRLVDLDAAHTTLAQSESLALAQQVSDAALTVVRLNDAALLPLRAGESAAATKGKAKVKPATSVLSPAWPPSSSLLVVIFSDDVRSENGQMLTREINQRAPKAHILTLDDALAASTAPRVLGAVAAADRVVVAIYATPTPGRTLPGEFGSPGLLHASSALLAALLEKAADKTVVVALGNPYLIAQYPAIRNYVCTFSNMSVSETSAARFLFGEIPARGTLPVTIPGVAVRGSEKK